MGSKLIFIGALFCIALIFGCTTGQAGKALAEPCSDDDGADIQNRGEGDSCAGAGAVKERICGGSGEEFLTIKCPEGFRCVSGACE